MNAPMKMRNPMETPAEDAGEMRRAAMNKGRLPGLQKLPKNRKDNPKDSPAKERAERRAGIRT
jgi:hypothetical protein